MILHNMGNKSQRSSMKVDIANKLVDGEELSEIDLKQLKEKSENNQNMQFMEQMLPVYLEMLKSREQFQENQKQRTRNTVLEIVSKAQNVLIVNRSQEAQEKQLKMVVQLIESYISASPNFIIQDDGHFNERQ